MANTNTLKQKVMDILFEDDPEPRKEIKREPTKIVQPPIKPRVRTEETPMQAKDLLYGKRNEHSSTFINLNEEIKKEVKEEKVVEVETFTPTPNISPIFGAIKNDEVFESVDENNKVEEEEPKPKYLETIISPIYGNYQRTNDFLSDNNQVEENIIQNVDITNDLLDTLQNKEPLQFKNNEFKKTSESIDLFSDFYVDKED